MQAEGRVRMSEVRGPPSFADWEACMLVVRNGMLGFKAVSLGIFDRYISMIRKYHVTFGDSMWCLIYQCDV
eukprot:7641789-Pyramimonas_sp.AAC.1